MMVVELNKAFQRSCCHYGFYCLVGF